MTEETDPAETGPVAPMENPAPQEDCVTLRARVETLERSKEKIREAHQQWMAALDAIDAPVFMHDKDFRILRSNRAYAERAGMSVREVIGKPYYEVFPHHDGPLPHCCVATQEAGRSEEEIRLESGEIFLSRASSITDDEGRYLCSLHIMEDVTERKRMEVALLESEEKFRSMSEASQDALILIDHDGNITFWNAAAGRMFGYSSEEVLGRDLHVLLTPPRLYESASQAFGRFRETGTGPIVGTTRELVALRKGGAEFPIELSVSALKFNGKWHAVGTVRDITERKRAEESLLRLNRVLETLSSCNRELVHGNDEMQLLQSMCRVVVEIGGYRMAWVGYAQQDAEKSIRPVAQVGFEEGYLDTVGFTWADDALGQRPAGRAVRSGSTQISQDMQLDPALSPWHAEAVKRGYASTIALPLADGGKIFGVLVIYAAGTNAFNEGEVALLQEMADDLAYGIGTLRLRLEQQRNMEKLRKGLEDTVLAISAMVEMRDPYTAGHERRVAELAAAIAVEMGLSDERVYGIHLAGTIHDLGKIRIPAEILSKPGRLNDVEYKLVKEHPQYGYEIVKNIEFPCPVAQMVLQHHERLDGTGYPRGMKGDEILMEARILSVADVVEAMSSHRPYRPSIALASALEEVSRNRGILYDPDVVDACLRLFREKNYSFNNAIAGRG